MNPILYTAFFTRNTRYEEEAQRLVRSLQKLNLEHEVVAVEDRGNWAANASLTAGHVYHMIQKHPTRTLVQLDADAVVWGRPVLLEELADSSVDIAAHVRRHHSKGTEMCNGTLLINPTPTAHAIVQRYWELGQANLQHADEQQLLFQAVKEAAVREGTTLRFHTLPAAYCWVHDWMAGELAAGEEPVIEHLQASRHAKQSKWLDSRLKRLKEIEGKI